MRLKTGYVSARSTYIVWNVNEMRNSLLVSEPPLTTAGTAELIYDAMEFCNGNLVTFFSVLFLLWYTMGHMEFKV